MSGRVTEPTGRSPELRAGLSVNPSQPFSLVGSNHHLPPFKSCLTQNLLVLKGTLTKIQMILKSLECGKWAGKLAKAVKVCAAEQQWAYIADLS